MKPALSLAKLGRDRRALMAHRRRSVRGDVGQLAHLQNRLVRNLIEKAPTATHAAIRRAANEAASLAWVTPYPLLLLPELVKEKTSAAVKQVAKQQRIYARSQSILWLAA